MDTTRYLTKEQKVESRAIALKEKLCRWCGLDVKRLSKHRRTFCSDECVHEFNLRSSSSYAREYIGKRDKYTCQLCGLECRGLIRQLWKYVNEEMPRLKRDNAIYADYKNYRHARKALEVEFFEKRGLPWVNTSNRSTFYDIDHILPVVEGGGKAGEDNLRCLCLICHRKETALLHKRRKAERDQG